MGFNFHDLKSRICIMVQLPIGFEGRIQELSFHSVLPPWRQMNLVPRHTFRAEEFFKEASKLFYMVGVRILWGYLNIRQSATGETIAELLGFLVRTPPAVREL